MKEISLTWEEKLLKTGVRSFGSGLIDQFSLIARPLTTFPHFLHKRNWGRINASTDLPLKHTRNKLYKELVLQHLVLQLFDDSRRGSTRFVSTGIRSTKI